MVLFDMGELLVEISCRGDVETLLSVPIMGVMRGNLGLAITMDAQAFTRNTMLLIGGDRSVRPS